MKKFGLIALLFAFVVSIGAFAAEEKAAAKSVKGTVAAYVAPDAAKKADGSLDVKVDAKTTEKFVVTADAKVKAGDKVEVKYTEDKGKKTAVSVTVAK